MKTEFISVFACGNTISVPEAILFGVPEGACVSLGAGTVIAGIAAFAIAVLTLQMIVKRLIFGRPHPASGTFASGPILSAREVGNRHRAEALED